MNDDDKACADCDGAVDADGVTTSECPVSPPSECEACYRCYCDGSC